MSPGLSLGISGIQVQLGDHICGLYSGERQRDQILMPFLESGLSAGDKCICVIDGTDPTDVIQGLDPHLNASACAANKQLDVIRSSDIYLRSGAFSAQEIISSWKAAMSEVMYDGRFDVARAVETWSQRDVVPGTRELYMLEAQMNHFLPLYPQVILCLYDIDRFGGGIVVDLLKTHPWMLVGGMLIENPYHLTPNDLIGEGSLAAGGTSTGEIEEAAEWCCAVTTGST